MENGGEGGIRTHGTLSRTPVFKTGAFNRSATSPRISAVFTGFDPVRPPQVYDFCVLTLFFRILQC